VLRYARARGRCGTFYSTLCEKGRGGLLSYTVPVPRVERVAGFGAQVPKDAPKPPLKAVPVQTERRALAMTRPWRASYPPRRSL
jgi:hypothetical protein